MWSFLVSIATRILVAYTGSPIAKQIIETVVNDIKGEGARILPSIVDNIKEIAIDEQLSGKGKFNYILNKTMLEAPNVTKKVADSLINLAFRSLQADPNTPEVQ